MADSGDIKRVVVIGGGVSGLAGALALKQSAACGAPLDWLLLEKDQRVGGKIFTDHRDGFVIDGGPDCYLSEKPWVARTAERLGIADCLLPSNDADKQTFIYARHRLHELPDGMMMMVPTKLFPLVATSLFSWPGKMRMGMDLVVPRRGANGDESLASFVRRRLGRECLDLLAEPMVGGVHASDPEQMSLQATFPRFIEMERRYRSLIRGFLKARRAPRPNSTAATTTQTYFMSFKAGMQELTDAMARGAGHGRIRLGAQVEAVEERTEGRRYNIRLAGGEAVEADAVLVGSESYQAAKFLRALDPELARLLEQVTWTSAATVSLAFHLHELPARPRGWGFLVPRVAERRIMAATLSSTKWPGRAPAGYLLVRAFVGGPHNGHLVELDDEAMVAMVREELTLILGLSPEPVFSRIYRWPQAMPQYRLGHLERLASAEKLLAKHTGLHLCGASYRGVGMGDCINSAETAVSRLMESLIS